MPRSSLIRIPAAKRKMVIALLDTQGVPLCGCCRHTEHDRDKSDKPWLVVQFARHPRNQLREPCRRCAQPCANVRCAELPVNPDGRGYGKLPIHRSLLSRILR